MNISYDKKSKLYVLGDTTYTKEQFISYIESDMLQSALETKSGSFDIEDLNLSFLEGGRNIIITGAPGTGKSHDTNITYSKNSIRCVFHSEYTNADFIGMYKPVPHNTNSVTYKFVAGPFTQALLNAYNNPNEMHNLIIEEINRADASAVFGEIFQLLDRDENGQSDYSITISKELHDYFVETLTSSDDDLIDLIINSSKIIIPSNLNIIATMNTSDQGVFTLDTAFKRRWIFEFKDIDFSKCQHANKLIEICGKKITWADFAKTINSHMMQNNMPEDRQLGPYFLREAELENEDVFASKLLFYIWTDIAKYDKENYFTNISTFSELVKQYKEGANIFSNSLLDKLNVFFK